MKIIAASSIALCAGLFAMAAQAAEKTIDVSDFDSIRASNGVKLVLEVGPEASLRLEGDADDFDDLSIVQDGGTIEIKPKPALFRFTELDITVYATTPSLLRVDGANGMVAEITGVDAESFDVDAARGAVIEVSGRCGELEVEAAMGGVIRAGQLVCDDVEVDASMGGVATINAQVSIDSEAAMGGVVRACGQAESRRLEADMGGRFTDADAEDCAAGPTES